MRIILIILILSVMPALRAGAGTRFDTPDWKKIQDVHFVVIYPSKETEDVPRTILRKAEEYYLSITDRIGYARYKNFWTWDERVQIVYFPTQAEFAAATGQPSWSNAFSVSHLAHSNLRMIVSYRGQANFLDMILPHEISHLVLHDFLGGRRPPLWFDEGVAQLNEMRVNEEENRAIMARLAVEQKTVPFSLLEGYSLKTQKDPTQVSIFYAESLYIVDFLIKTYGSDAFKELCRALRDGKTFQDALKVGYYPTLDSMSGMEAKWLDYMRQFVR